ncbi:MAG: hypothetical protein NVSMB39_7250 [Candidatus Saccharimonadales bacterium]
MNIIKHKYHYHAYILVFVAAIILVFLGSSSPIRADEVQPESLPPAAPVAVSAILQGDKVVVSWQAAQAGSNPVGGYIVSRRGVKDDFEELGRPSGTQFEDQAGRPGYIYRVVAFDNQQAALQSEASDAATVEEPAPAGLSSSPDIALAPNELKAVDHQKVSNTIKIDTDAEAKISDDKLAKIESGSQNLSDNVIHTLLNQFSQSKDELIVNRDRLNSAQRQQAAQVCLDQGNRLETALFLSSESIQMQVIEALARCQLLQ